LIQFSPFTSVLDLAAALQRGDLTTVDVVDACLERIAACEPSLNAVVRLRTHEAREAARRADGLPVAARGPLHGVPFSAKDVFLVKGEVATAGLTDRIGVVSSETAVAVDRLTRAGAILVAKTNCPAGGAGGESDNPVHGRTNHPRAADRTPGGSSGGEAALLSTGASLLGIGSDSGGSLRVPAHFCGVFSFKPSTGRVPNTGTINHPGGLSDPRTQIGPMGHSVDDLELVFSLLSGADGSDSGVFVPDPYTRPGKDVGAGLAGLRVGFFTDDGLHAPSTAIVRAVATVAQAARGLGALVEECLPYDPQAALDVTTRYWNAAELPGGEYERLQTDWDAFRTRLFGAFRTCDVFIGPVCPHTAPLHGGVTVSTFAYTLPYSLLGAPCLVVPIGLDEQGLPLGIQLAAAPWHEATLFRVGRALEKALGLKSLLSPPASVISKSIRN